MWKGWMEHLILDLHDWEINLRVQFDLQASSAGNDQIITEYTKFTSVDINKQSFRKKCSQSEVVNQNMTPCNFRHLPIVVLDTKLFALQFV